MSDNTVSGLLSTGKEEARARYMSDLWLGLCERKRGRIAVQLNLKLSFFTPTHALSHKTMY
jgi:hypothetical protein